VFKTTCSVDLTDGNVLEQVARFLLKTLSQVGKVKPVGTAAYLGNIKRLSTQNCKVSQGIFLWFKESRNSFSYLRGYAALEFHISCSYNVFSATTTPFLCASNDRLAYMFSEAVLKKYFMCLFEQSTIG
jgi:hypothetical protein